ncbi:hypothetical protein [Streptomyces sp. AN091965]|uniref:hypothetical protein n=1 Tax=Streptomyces sp. AN091965 TaxID=2927803 RepID=UPI001F624605|nr:hypothetical protein [Streptomyces sp. AN091965]MCI3927745.1 hypothetical protein [Streptomyces sp. AN091965]
MPGRSRTAPGLRRRLAFDSELLRRFGWFGPGHSFTPRTLGRLAREEFGDGWAACYEPLPARFEECFLLPGGSGSRRVLATGAVDEYGAYPVFALGIGGLPRIEPMYPGLDVHLADTAGLITRAGRGCSAPGDDRAYGPRMRTHARRVFGGGLAEECLG